MSQIAEVLNDPKTEHIYKDPEDYGRDITVSNIVMWLKKVFPPEDDTQAAVELLGTCVSYLVFAPINLYVTLTLTEQCKGLPGWENMMTIAEDRDGVQGLQIHRLTIIMPLARELLYRFGDFLLIDATFKLTIYQGR